MEPKGPLNVSISVSGESMLAAQIAELELVSDACMTATPLLYGSRQSGK